MCNRLMCLRRLSNFVFSDVFDIPVVSLSKMYIATATRQGCFQLLETRDITLAPSCDVTKISKETCCITHVNQRSARSRASSISGSLSSVRSRASYQHIGHHDERQSSAGTRLLHLDERERGIDISRLTRVHLTVSAYYNERARISDREERGRSAATGRASRVRPETAQGDGHSEEE